MTPLPRPDRHHGNIHFSAEAVKAIVANGWDKPEGGFTVTPARYARGMLAVRPRRDGTGWKTWEALSVPPGSRFSNREGAYIMSPAQVEKYAADIAAVNQRRAATATGDGL